MKTPSMNLSYKFSVNSQLNQLINNNMWFTEEIIYSPLNEKSVYTKNGETK